jgi:hypothetical protein
MSERINVLQVHLGGTLPPYIYEQIRQTRLFNPRLPVFLILNRATEADMRALKELDVTVVRKETIVPCRNHRDFMRRHRFSRRSLGGFWLYTSERFYAIESFLQSCALRNVVHMENDVMLYADLEGLLPTLSARCPRIGITMDSDTRCVPGFVFIKDAEALAKMNGHMVRKALRTTKNDMRAIAHFMNGADAGDCSALPVIPTGYRGLYPLENLEGEKGQKSWYDEAFPDFGGVFDAAALGQYLGGIDPKISEGDTRGFISETAVYDPRNMGLKWIEDSGFRRPFGSVAGKDFPVFNLHIHSKRLDEFSSLAKAKGG